MTKPTRKELTTPPYEELMPPKIILQKDTLLQGVESVENASLEDTLEAIISSELFLESRYQAFPSLQTEGRSSAADFLFLQKFFQKSHGKMFVGHAHGNNTKKTMGSLLQEAHYRSRLDRLLLVAPTEVLWIWKATIESYTKLELEEWTDTQESPPRYGFCSWEHCGTKWNFETTNVKEHDWLVCIRPHPLKKRRSSAFKNLFSLDTKNVLLQTFLPFEQAPYEMSSYFAFMGLENVPPASHFKQQFRDTQETITLETRQFYRSFLESNFSRELPKKSPASSILWKELPVAQTADMNDLQQSVFSLLLEHRSSLESTVSIETIISLMASPESLLSTIHNHTEIRQIFGQERLEQWSGKKLQTTTKKAHTIANFITHHPTKNILILCWTCSSADIISEYLQKRTKPAKGQQFVVSSVRKLPRGTQDIDCILIADFVWFPHVMEELGYYLFDGQQDKLRYVYQMLRTGSLEMEWWKRLQERYQLDSLHQEELISMSEVEQTQDQRAHFWNFLELRQQEEKSKYFDELFLNTRRDFRRLYDRQHRLFLDEYSHE